MKMVRLFLSIVAIVFLVGGCDSGGGEGAPSDSGATDGKVSEKRHHLTFPLQDPTNYTMDALLTGKLVNRSGCLYVMARRDSHPVLPIWPHGFSYQVEADRITIIDERASPILQTGDRVSMGGGLLR